MVGYNAYVWRDTGKTTNVGGFTKAVGVLKNIPIVDAIVCYDCPYSHRVFNLVIYNALYIPENADNLVPPFMIREAGIKMSEVPKIQVADPSIDDHSLFFAADNFRIHLQLYGIISCFDTRKPTKQEVLDLPRLDLTSNTPVWDPHNTIYARQEECMLDFEGNIVERVHRDKLLLQLQGENDDDSDDFDPANYVAEVEMFNSISAVEEQVDEVCKTSMTIGAVHHLEGSDIDGEYNALCDINELLTPEGLANCLNERAAFGKFAMAAGCTTSEPDFVVGASYVDRPKGITPERLAKVFCIDKKTAERTIDVTSQRIRRTENPTLDRHYSTNDRPVRYNRIDDHFFMDTLLVSKKIGPSKRGNTCAQIFVTDKGYVLVMCMKKRKDLYKAVKYFFKKLGVPNFIVADPIGEHRGGPAHKVCSEAGCDIRLLEKNTPWANRAELYIGLFKRAVKKDLMESNAPLALWDYCLERRMKVHNCTARDLFQLEDQTPHYHVHGTEPDISNVSRFEWYEWVYFRDADREGFPQQDAILGRALGPCENASNEMAQWVMRIDGRVFPRRTLRSLTDIELQSPIEQKKRDTFDAAIQRILGDSMTKASDEMMRPEAGIFGVDEDPLYDAEEIAGGDADAVKEDDGIDEDVLYDKFINAEVMLPNGDVNQCATVVRRTMNLEGDTYGTAHANPMLDTRVYDVMFEDGTVKQYGANIIAENIYSQVDQEGFQYLHLQEILEHRKTEEAVERDDMYIYNSRGNRGLRKTTAGWDFKVLWKDGSSSWTSLRELKESNPVDIAEYAVANQIDREPAFRWWVPFTLRKRDRIIAAVNSRVKKSNFKYGIKVPLTVKEALAIDKANGNDFWWKAILKEMSNVMIAFDIIEADARMPAGYELASVHMVFDVKMDGTRKARLVKDGHKTSDPDGSRYAGVVSRESVRIALTYAALNDLDVFAADIRNAYLQAAPSEKHYIICGPEFGLENIGKRAIVKRALYGGKVSGRDFRNALRSCMNHVGFKSCLADPDVWMRKAEKPDGSKYWEYVLIYTDDCLCISHKGEHVLREEIGKYFNLKEESVGPPTIYLGAKVGYVTLDNGVNAWSLGSSQYVQAAVKNVERHLQEIGGKLPTKATTPLSSDYRPEVDVSNELEAEEAAYYQSLIGVLRWIVELGRVDICLEVSMMSSYLAMPRAGHMEQLLHMFAYLKRNHNAELVLDPSPPNIDLSLFPRQDWEATEFGNDLEEELPENRPEERGFGFVMTAYVDADHAGDSVTRRSRTGFLVYLNSAPIYWFIKKQNSVETSTFGSEFMAMKQCTEYVRGLRYKLRMLGIPCEIPTLIYGDNKSVLINASVPDSQLKKKSNSIAYHFVREGCARDEWRLAYINTHFNPADLLTKTLPAGEKRVGFVRMILHHLFGGGHDD